MQGSAPNGLPQLPKLPLQTSVYAGPTPWSNWVIPGRIMAGAYPASLDDAETERILTTLLELGMNTFVCLQAEVNINTPEHAWRSQHGLRPYIIDAQKILSKAHETGNPRITQNKIDFLHLPIIDGNVTTDSAMNRLAEDCIERVLRGEKMYIHCWGGHGRTGTLVAVMMGRLYNQPYTSALRYTQAFHDARVYPQGVRSPQTPVQRAQVRRLLTAQSAGSAPSPLMNIVQQQPARSAAVGLNQRGPSPVFGKAGAAAAPALGARIGSTAQEARNSITSPSPLRNRPAAASSNTRPYGSKLLGEQPGIRTSSDVRPGELAQGAVLDKLTSDFNKMQGPSRAAAANGFMLAQR